MHSPDRITRIWRDTKLASCQILHTFCFSSKYVPALRACCLIARENPPSCLQCQWPLLEESLLLCNFERLWATRAVSAAAHCNLNTGDVRFRSWSAVGMWSVFWTWLWWWKDNKSLYINAVPRTHKYCPLDQSCFIMQKPHSCLRVHGAVNSCTTSSDRNEKWRQNIIWPYFEEWIVFPRLLGPKGSCPPSPYSLVSQII